MDSWNRIITTDTPLIMGVINCTPDSFYAGGREPSAEAAVETAARMIREGADILDIGGESSRPGSAYIDADEEEARILPVIEQIRRHWDIPLSVDTRKAAVAEKALQAGADIINDISAMDDDPDMAILAAARRVPVILMHMKGNPLTMQKEPFYRDTLREIAEYLAGRAEAALNSGIREDRIILDPGIGFGKRLEDNLVLLRSLEELKKIGYPLLIGASRKSFIGALLGENGSPLPPEERLVGTITVHLWSMLKGVKIIRVHDVKPHAEMRKIYSALTAQGEE